MIGLPDLVRLHDVGDQRHLLLLPFPLLVAHKWNEVGTGSVLRRRDVVQAIALGCALSVKPLAWFVAPFLIFAIWQICAHRSGMRIAMKITTQYTATAIAAAMLINAPFIVWNAGAWWRGVLAPIRQHVVPDGQGLVDASLFFRLGGGNIGAYTTAAAFLLVAALAAQSRFFPAMGRVALVTPAFILFFPARSLAAYFMTLRRFGSSRSSHAGMATSPSPGSEELARSAGCRPSWLPLLWPPRLSSESPWRPRPRSTFASTACRRTDNCKACGRFTSTFAIGRPRDQPAFRHERVRSGDHVLGRHPRPEDDRSVEDGGIRSTRRTSVDAGPHDAVPPPGRHRSSRDDQFFAALYTAAVLGVPDPRLCQPGREGRTVDPLRSTAPVALRSPGAKGRHSACSRTAHYGQSDLIPSEARINRGNIGQSPVYARTDTQGIARFVVRSSTRANGNAIYFQSWIAPRHGYPFGYSEIVDVLWR